MSLKAKSASSKVPTKPANGITSQDKTTTSEHSATGPATRPDKKTYDAEQDRIKGEIDALQAKLAGVRDKISLVTKGGVNNEKRNTLRAELDSIRGQQDSGKSARGRVLDQIQEINDRIHKKIKDLQASKAKMPFKTVADVDAHIELLERRVESGSMKLAEEKRALQEISQCKRNRRLVETFEADQATIDADRATVEDLRKQLEDPEVKAASDRYEAIKAELAELKKEEDELYANRNKLFAERDEIQAKLNDLFNAKRQSAADFREANDRYWAKVNEDRARRAERARAQRAAEEADKKREVAERLREEAEIPAFQAQIEDCQTLIDAFSGKTTGSVILKTATVPQDSKEIAGVQKLDIRKVESVDDAGLVARKKKGEDEEAYFVGGKGKKSKKGPKQGAEATVQSDNINLPLAQLSALLSLSIPPPVSAADLPRVIEDLNTKKAWFEANQARVTAENIARAEAEIQKLAQKAETAASVARSTSQTDVTGPNGGGERPPEPAPTPSAADPPAVAVPSEAVDEKLEAVEEQS